MREATRRWVDRGALVLVVAGFVVTLVQYVRDSAPPPSAAPGTVAPRDLRARPPVDSAPAPSAPARVPLADASARDQALRDRFARSSLRGTQPDGEIRFDAAGRLIPDAALRRVFDYWLALDGEFTPAEIRELLRTDTVARHGAAAADAVLTVFDRYVALLSHLAAHPPQGDTAERLAQLRAARRQWFGEDAEAMFGAEEAHVEYTLQRQRIESDPALSASERTARLDTLEATRPAAERQAQRDATSAHLAEEQTRQLDAAAADAATRLAERRDLWGPEAAARLAALDAARARWEARLAAVARERARLDADPRLDAAARERALAAMLRRDFDDAERARVEALLRTGTLPPGG